MSTEERFYAYKPLCPWIPQEKKLTKSDIAIREAAENSLEAFIRLVAPYRVLGQVHLDVIEFWENPQRKQHQLLLLPRDHAKSAMVGFRSAQAIVKQPDERILYISSTANLAEKQLKFIKDILTSDAVRKYWPELVNPEEGQREKWASTEIIIDHPLRKLEGVRDSTVFTGGLTTSLTGLHCSIAVLDDVVVKENAQTREGRNNVKAQYSLLSSIEGSDSEEWVVGTRYHPKDLYNDMKEMEEEIYDDKGDVVATLPIYEIFERPVEDRGDGGGNFLWPRQQREDGKWFGFNQKILARKRAQYMDKMQFRAQYYNDPNDPEGAKIREEHFQYYERDNLKLINGNWHYGDRRINIGASIDFAFSTKAKADYTALIVTGMDYERNVYVLDIARFKTEDIREYFQEIVKMKARWDFNKIRMEVTAGQKAIVKSLKMDYIRPSGMILSVEEFNPRTQGGNKEERIAATLEPLYQSHKVFHYDAPIVRALESELVSAAPPHDDIKDAMACCVDMLIAPHNKNYGQTLKKKQEEQLEFNSRFGGIN